MKKFILNSSGFFALLSAAIIFGSFGVLIRELAKMFSDYGQVAFRAGVAVILLICYILYKQISVKIDRSNIAQLVLFSLSFPLSVIFFTLSVNDIKASNTVFMLYVGSMFTAFLFGSIIHKESVTKKKLLALVIVLVGFYMFVYPFDIETIGSGIIFGLISGFFDGITNGLRKSLGKYRRESLLMYQYGTGALLAVSLAFLSGDAVIRDVSINTIAVGLVFGCALILIGNLLIYGFNHIDVNIGTIVLATELFFSLIINFLILSESPTTYELLGGVIIFLAAIVGNVDFNYFRRKYGN